MAKEEIATREDPNAREAAQATDLLRTVASTLNDRLAVTADELARSQDLLREASRGFPRGTAPARFAALLETHLAQLPQGSSQWAAALDALLRCAAQALYHAKAAGRNTVESYRGERRRFRRVDLAPRRVEIEVLGAEPPSRGRIRDASRGGILFVGPEAFDVGAALEVRLPAEPAARPADGLRGTVVRVDRLPTPVPVPGATLPDRFEIGLALGESAPDGVEDAVDLFRGRREGEERG